MLALHGSQKERQLYLDVSALVRVNVDQFYGIEIEEFPAQIAQVALWLMDHQMNQMVSEEFGLYFVRIPLRSSPNIICANALTTDWNEIIPAQNLSYIFGNPPFVGKKEQSKKQKQEVLDIFKGVKGSGIIDYVSCWFMKAVLFIQGTRIECAFVSTNSITQGEQVSVVWPALFEHGATINFAHKTFKWSNEAKGKAAVHCVIIGFSLHERSKKFLYTYSNVTLPPERSAVKNINAYLVDAPNVLLPNRTKSILNMPKLIEGITPLDNGHLLLSPEEKGRLLETEPQASQWIKRWYSGNNFINNILHYCLWLSDIEPHALRHMPKVLEKVERVREFRLNSKSSQSFATRPWQFRETKIADQFLLIPKTSSENRSYIPMGIITGAIASNACLMLPNATLYHFGILTSTMHNAWMRAVAGRLESRYRYSVGIVYNNFPWPQEPSDTKRQAIENAAQAVLDARALFPESSLADLYDPLTMPPVLLKAHHKLDKAVDAAYGRSFASEADRVAFLFALYGQYVGEGRMDD